MNAIRQFGRSFFFVLAVLTANLINGKTASAQQDAPVDVFGDSIDNQLIYRHVETQGGILVTAQQENAVATLHDQLESATRSSSIKIQSLSSVGNVNRQELYQHMVKSSLFLGKLFNCGRCDRTHAAFSGGVVIGEDGLALTNYHVLEANDRHNTEGYMAMTWDGRCFGIEKVLAADESADIALIQLRADGYKFHAAPIAASRPTPMNPVRVISHPSGEFFVLTQGEVSRYAKVKNQIWMEITADFGGGSSGSGVFNDRGEVVGLVSRIYPIVRDKQKAAGNNARKNRNSQALVEMILKRCVSLQAIHECFAK